MRAGSMPLRSTSAFRMVAASWSAGSGRRLPPKAPTAVRRGETMAALLMWAVSSRGSVQRHDAHRQRGEARHRIDRVQAAAGGGQPVDVDAGAVRVRGIQGVIRQTSPAMADGD